MIVGVLVIVSTRGNKWIDERSIDTVHRVANFATP